mmetsp:Transcript_20077/g.63916  ORF Transcript_20077/g.63916 Transcript_20077/m.63916 type:complete len:224 (-) Transcript_20077:432-1103(-)
MEVENKKVWVMMNTGTDTPRDRSSEAFEVEIPAMSTAGQLAEAAKRTAICREDFAGVGPGRLAVVYGEAELGPKDAIPDTSASSPLRLVVKPSGQAPPKSGNGPRDSMSSPRVKDPKFVDVGEIGEDPRRRVSAPPTMEEAHPGMEGCLGQMVRRGTSSAFDGLSFSKMLKQAMSEVMCDIVNLDRLYTVGKDAAGREEEGRAAPPRRALSARVRAQVNLLAS